jgi:hypothetical protein
MVFNRAAILASAPVFRAVQFPWRHLLLPAPKTQIAVLDTVASDDLRALGERGWVNDHAAAL